jgi:hypothetical protein
VFGAAAGGKSKTSLNVAAEIGVIPHTMTVQAAVRLANNGSVPAAGAAAADTDNALMVGAVYELAQNIGLSLTRTQQSGSAWNTDAAGNQPVGKTATTLLLEVLF